MKKTTLLIIVLLISQICLGQWTNLNSGIADTLTDIVFFDQQGVVTGENGLYYTLNGGDGSANWQRFEITDNTQLAQLYANTEFTSCYSNPNSSPTNFKVYAVGEDIVNNKAVIMSLEFPSLIYNIVSLDLPNSRLTDIKYGKEFSKYYAVGNNGLLLTIVNDISTYAIVNNSITDDYTAINFNSAGYLAQIGSYNKYFRLNTFTFALDEYSTPGEIHNDLTSTPFSVNDKYMRHSFTNKIVYSEYDYGPINGNTILASGIRNFIGTDHGIFMSNTDKDILQWQPSSGTAEINAFWRINSSSTMFACGPNGTILKHETANNEAKPYARIVFDGGCLSESTFEITAITGDTTTCAWYIDDVFVSSDCESFIYSFSTVGTYNIKLEATFNGITTQSLKTAYIVNDPQIDKPINIVDNILCHEEPVQIEISNSEPDVVYTLHRAGSNAIYGTSPVGNGSTIILNSSPLTETDNYVLKSANANVRSCTKTFTDTFEIIVEQTEANFHVGLINAATNEALTFFQNSIEANIFNWTFTTAANTLTSTEENATNAFNTPGIHDVTLTASSANLCTDDITLDGPNVYTAPTDNTECWMYINESLSANGSNSSLPDISHMSEVTDGYLTGGNYKNEIFGTNHGIEFHPNDVSGGFLSKHDNYGALKWMVYTTGPSNSAILASVEDQNGDIYLSINGNDCVFYDNSGKSVTFNDNGGRIVKLTSKGELIWYMSIRTYNTTGFTIDANNDLIGYGTYDIYNDTQHDVYLNDVLVDEVGTIIFPDSGANRFCNAIMKITPEGSIVWDNEIFSITGTGGSSIQVKDIGVDANNNYYVEGQYKNHMYIYHTGATESTDLDYLQYSSSGSFYDHVLKFNSDGALQWVNRSYAIENGIHKSVYQNDSTTDENGNTYITGYSNYGGAQFNHFHNVENADGSTFSSDEAQTYFLKKINADGITQWIVGTEDENTSTSKYSKGFQIEVKNNVVTTIGRVKSNITTPEDVVFKSLNDDNITAPVSANDLFINSYTTEGVLNKVSVFSSIIDDPYYTTYKGLISKGSNNYYVSSIYTLSSQENGRVNFLNSDYCGVTYNSTLSVEDFDNETIVAVVPNPNNGEFRLILNTPYSNCKVSLYNILGQLITKEEFTNNSDINLKITGESGIYFAEISFDNNFKQSVKVIVK